MPFALTNDPSQSEISEAINYLLANFGANLVVDPSNGQITGSSGIIIAYFYKYLAVKYADSYDGTVNFSNSPTNRTYYGLRNTDSSVESTNPADYIWYQATGGFGTTKFLFYQTGGGRQINFVVATTAPDATYIQESGPAIDLDIVTTVTAYNTAAPSIYIWTSSSTPPTRPSTTSTYTWSTRAYTAPSGWTTEPTSNTTPGYYLWAITIPLVVNTNVTTSTLDWTNTSYPIYAFSYNGTNGTSGATGATGLSAITAYRAQSQSSAAPSTPANTTGATAPSGWSLTAPSVAVGDVLWYTFGQYNSSSGTISGIPAGQTQWGTPTAASIFQDIRSDNWNGGTPPTTGPFTPLGTAGYYIQQATGNMYLNSIYGQGIADFYGANSTYSGTTSAIRGNFSGTQTYGVFGYSGTGGAGVAGVGFGASQAGGNFQSIGGGNCIQLPFGTMTINNSTLVTNLNANYLQGYTASSFYVSGGALGTPSSGNLANCTFPTLNQNTTGNAATATYATSAGSASSATYASYLGGYSDYYWARIFPTNSGTANAAGSGLNLLGSSSTGIAGAYVGTSGSGNTVTFTVQTSSPSDPRLKKDIQDIDLGLQFVKGLIPKKYRLIHDPKEQFGYGFLTTDVEKLIPKGSSLVYHEPDLMAGDEKGFDVVHYPSYIAVLVKAIQELSAEVEALKAKG